MDGNTFMFGWFIGILSAIVVLFFSYEPTKEFKSEVKITPSIELQIVNNKVDSLYVYKIK